MLRVQLLGNVGADAETRVTPAGMSITTIRVAVDQLRRAAGAEGAVEEVAEWFRVRSSGRVGERMADLTKGAFVLVVGRLTIERYTTRDGKPGVGFEVWADEVVNLSSRPSSASGTGADNSGEVAASDPPVEDLLIEPEPRPEPEPEPEAVAEAPARPAPRRRRRAAVSV